MASNAKRTAATNLVDVAKDLLKRSEELRKKADSSSGVEQAHLLDESRLKAVAAKEVGDRAMRMVK